MSQSANFPSIRPSLLLDFANAKTLDPRVTFTRASSATFYGEDGLLRTAASGVPRFTFDPVTEESLGLLIEESRTNLALWSEEFGNAAWLKTGATVTANAIVAPDGTLTGDKLVEDTSTGQHRIRATATGLANNVTRAFSFHVKAAERTFLRMQINAFSNNFLRADVNLGTGVITTTVSGNATLSGATATDIGNGWWRIAVSGVPNTADSGTSVDHEIRLMSGANADSYTGDGTSGIFIWGAQLEAGAFPTSYIQTVASQVTRSADVASMTGANFSSWYNNAEGTVFADIASLQGSIPYAYSMDTGSIVSEIRVGSSSSGASPALSVTVNSVSQASIGVALGAYLPYKSAASYGTDNFNHSVNGILGTADSSGTVPTVSQLSIGRRSNGLQYLNGTIKKIAYYAQRLPDAQLQALTA